MIGDKVEDIKMVSRYIDSIIIHCSATEYTRHYTAEDINQWHLEAGYNEIGYHYVIYTDGTVVEGRDLNKEGAHAKGYNNYSIGICLVGGTGPDGIAYDNGYSTEQYKSLHDIIMRIDEKFPIEAIAGHKEIPDVNKACPCLTGDVLNLIRSLV